VTAHREIGAGNTAGIPRITGCFGCLQALLQFVNGRSGTGCFLPVRARRTRRLRSGAEGYAKQKA